MEVLLAIPLPPYPHQECPPRRIPLLPGLPLPSVVLRWISSDGVLSPPFRTGSSEPFDDGTFSPGKRAAT